MDLRVVLGSGLRNRTGVALAGVAFEACAEAVTELCNGCGACCRVILLTKGRAEMVAGIEQGHHYVAPGARDTERTDRWVVEDLTEISYEEAHERYPLLARFLLKPGDKHFFKCARFDEETNRCTDHENRPSVCRGFPGYGGPIYRHNLIAYPDCGYHAVAEDAITFEGETPQEETNG